LYQGGGDYAEAVLDALDYASEKLEWNQVSGSCHVLFLICDAPPHGNYCEPFRDDFPEGCPCHLMEEIVFSHLKSKDIRLVVLTIGKEEVIMTKMIDVFRTYYGHVYWQHVPFSQINDTPVRTIGECALDLLAQFERGVFLR
jgi:hypothetical protein